MSFENFKKNVEKEILSTFKNHGDAMRLMKESESVLDLYWEYNLIPQGTVLALRMSW